MVIHESDSVPGRANRLAGRFARRIAVSWRDAAEFFPSEKTAWTGHPVRSALREPVDQTAARAFLKLEPDIPIIFVLGGSQGAQKINELILQTLPQLVERYQIIHQTGVEHLAEMSARADVILSANSHASRYRPFAFLNEHALAMAASVATLAVSRAGSTIFEIAGWGIPSIIIPITESNGDHQRKNAYAYAESGAAAVLEEANLSPTLLLAEIRKIMEDSAHAAAMSAAARTFNNPRAARTIAEKLVEIGLSHES